MKKVKGKGAVTVIVLIVIIAAVLAAIFFLLPMFGIGKGSGEGDRETAAVLEEAEESESTAPVTETTVQEEETVVTTVEEIAYADVTVKENGYLYQNESIELDALADALKNLDAGTHVRIKDEDASLNAYNALTAKLDELSIAYEEKKD